MIENVGVHTIPFQIQLTYPEFPFESEAKGDNLIGVHQQLGPAMAVIL